MMFIHNGVVTELKVSLIKSLYIVTFTLIILYAGFHHKSTLYGIYNKYGNNTNKLKHNNFTAVDNNKNFTL